MNPDTEKNINEAIDWLQQAGGSVQDFAVEQAPLYCREVVQWTLWSSVGGVVFAILLIVGACKLAKLGDWSWEEDSPIKAFAVPGICLAAWIASVVLLANCAPLAIKAAVAPRLVIVEHLRGLK